MFIMEDKNAQQSTRLCSRGELYLCPTLRFDSSQPGKARTSGPQAIPVLLPEVTLELGAQKCKEPTENFPDM